ncbi:hypothetical protein [Calidifontibacillus oryziterrae]|uniref:hypothetical protein n=1 Tax=Calidifontibacillus oryziterrae TaxID=1191699 RepID=UPI0003174E62|nr:hypothetical protein [Calidifontibacillus oryziterrae]
MAKTIKEIEEILNTPKTLNDDIIEQISTDERKGVQVLYQKWLKNEKNKQKAKEKYDLMSAYENELRAKNIHMIAGVDEVGRVI